MGRQIIAVLTALYPAVTVIMARIFLSERWTALQAAGFTPLSTCDRPRHAGLRWNLLTSMTGGLAETTRWRQLRGRAHSSVRTITTLMQSAAFRGPRKSEIARSRDLSVRRRPPVKRGACGGKRRKARVQRAGSILTHTIFCI